MLSGCDSKRHIIAVVEDFNGERVFFLHLACDETNSVVIRVEFGESEPLRLEISAVETGVEDSIGGEVVFEGGEEG